MVYIYILQNLKIEHILTGVATDSHRLSSSSIEIDQAKLFIL